MNKNVIKKLIRIHSAELKSFDDFPFMSELCEVSDVEKMSPEDFYYTALGYSPCGKFSSKEVYNLRKLAATFNYDAIREQYNLKNREEVSKLLGRAKAVPDIIKKGSVPEEFVREVRALSSYLIYSRTCVLADSNDNIMPVRDSVMRLPLDGRPYFDTYVKNITPIIMDGLSVMASDSDVRVKMNTIYTPNPDLIKEKLQYVVENAIYSMRYPLTYMDKKLAVKVATYHNLYFEDDFIKMYVNLMDYLHFNNIPFSTIINSMGISHPDFIQIYTKTNSFSFQLAEDLYVVSNDLCTNERLSKSDFEFCLDRGFLSQVFVSKGAVNIQTEQGVYRLDSLKGVS